MKTLDTSKNKDAFNMLSRKTEFYRHGLEHEDKEALINVLDSIFLTTGDVVKEFEDKFFKYVGSKFAVGVMSCTHALELALRFFSIGSGDEVITTPMSFVATANVIELLGAKPVFVDVEPTTGNIDADLIEAAITPKTKAIIPVHLYGQMCDMKKIRSIADRYGLKVIEDAAHCIEGVRDGVRPGNMSDAACFSFYATKNLTCGEGGAITCNNSEMYEWLLSARQHGINKDAATRYTKKYEHYDMKFIGMKCNMSNIQAALLIKQIDRLEENWKKRDSVACWYNKALEGSFTNVPHVLPNVRHALHLYTIWVDPSKRNEYLHIIQDEGVGVAVNYTPIHLMSYYRKEYGYTEKDFPEAEKIGSSTISLPFYSKLTQDEVRYVVSVVNKLAV